MSGTPYKTYARTAGLRGHPLPALLAWSVPARAPRVLLVTGVVGAPGAWHRRQCPEAPDRLRWAAFGLGWAAFSAWFFRTVGR